MRKFILFIMIILLCSLSLCAQEQIFSLTEADSLLDSDFLFRKKPNIAVLPFTDANAQAKEVEFGRTVAAMLATALRGKTNFIVLERSELNQILTEKTLGLSGITREMNKSLNVLFNVEVVVGGDVSLINTTLHIDARLIETMSSKIVVALYATCQDLKQIRQIVEGLAQQLEQTYLRQWMGRIRIVSEPAGAEVYLEGKYIGLTNDAKPLEINNLLEGTYNLKFIRGGYFDWEGDIAVLAKMERSVKVSLIAKPGSINIYSEPGGAQIFVDNNYMGVTPMSLKKVAEGEHEIRLAKENFKQWTQKVIVRSFQPTDVKATLEVSPGMLTVNSIPEKADIYFKGKFVASTPYTISNIQPGEVVVRVEKANYEEWTTSVYIQPNKHEVLDIVLKEKVGALTITSNPESANVYLKRPGDTERQSIGITPVLNYTTNIGNYIIEVEKENYYIKKRNILVTHKSITEALFELIEKPGRLWITTSPRNARIYLDDTFKGRSPLLIKNIPKGIYQIDIHLPFAREKRKIEAKPNQQTNINASFQKSENYIIPMTSIGVIALIFHLIAK